MAQSALMTVMIKAVEKAGRSLARDFNEVEKLQVSQKGPGEFVSRADTRAEEIIRESLEHDRPGWGFLGEESGEIIRKEGDGEHRWIVDPLDGTTNFLHGIPYWATTIALQKGKDIVAAVTLDPVQQELFTAEKGQGALVNRMKMRVSGRRDLTTCVGAMHCGRIRAAPPERLADYLAAMERAHDTLGAVRINGCPALDLAYVAAGRLEFASYAQLNVWDYAAGMLMIRESGGTVTDFKGRQRTLEEGEVLACPAHLHKDVLKIVKG